MTRLASRFLLFAVLLTGGVTADAQKAPALPRQAPNPAPPPAAHTAPAPATAPAPVSLPAPPPPAPVPMPGIPALGRLRIFEDWAVGCDNQLSCSAVSLLPEGAGEVYSVLVWIERGGGPDGESTLELSGAYDLRGKVDLLIDNEPVGQLVAARDMARADSVTAFKLIRRLGSSYSFEVRQGKTSLAAPSLSGLAMALRYMDEQQGRVGSEAALAAIGDKPADLARPLPAPTTAALATDGSLEDGPVILTDEERLAARHLALCDGRPRDSYPVEAHALDGGHVLALAACDAGTDNVSSIVLVGEGEPGARIFRIARFDLMPGFTGEPGALPLIVNAQWNPAKAMLSSFARGRPLGDCGTSETYRWDGAMFRLIQARAMPVCRGAWEWPVLWSAKPIDAPPTLTAGLARSP